MRARFKGDAAGPGLVVFDTRRDFIRTAPVLQHDPPRPEDLDTSAEDHVAVGRRYACVSRPLPRAPTEGAAVRRRDYAPRPSGGAGYVL